MAESDEAPRAAIEYRVITPRHEPRCRLLFYQSRRAELRPGLASSDRVVTMAAAKVIATDSRPPMSRSLRRYRPPAFSRHAAGHLPRRRPLVAEAPHDRRLDWYDGRDVGARGDVMALAEAEAPGGWADKDASRARPFARGFRRYQPTLRRCCIYKLRAPGRKSRQFSVPATAWAARRSPSYHEISLFLPPRHDVNAARTTASLPAFTRGASLRPPREAAVSMTAFAIALYSLVIRLSNDGAKFSPRRSRRRRNAI